MIKDYKENFEAWAADCVRITDKLTGLTVAFHLNAPQKRVLGVLEDMRRRRRPIRLIMLKARQWGGSTLIQVYMAWMQLVRREGWNSLICAHVKDASAQIRGMYSQLLRDYPEGMKRGHSKDWTFIPYEHSQSVCWIPARRTQVAIATSLSPNTLRGSNFAMAHLSEVAFWADGDEKAASEIVRTVSGSIAREADTMVVMESTANGTDNFFYHEWRRAVEGKSDKTPVFVPWHEIDIYRRILLPHERKPMEDALDEYERALLEQGIELERVAWYHDKRREYSTHEAMMAEFPSTAEEAFANAGFDRLLRPEEVARCEESFEATADSLIIGVLLVGGDGNKHLLSMFGCDNRGRLGCISDQHLDYLTLPRLLAESETKCRDLGGILHIAQVAYSAGTPQAEWCAARAERSGMSLCYDSDERPYTAIDCRSLREMAASYSALVLEETIIETNLGARQELLRAALNAPQLTPLALSRLVAASIYATSTSAKVSLADFM